MQVQTATGKIRDRAALTVARFFVVVVPPYKQSRVQTASSPDGQAVPPGKAAGQLHHRIAARRAGKDKQQLALACAAALMLAAALRVLARALIALTA